MQGTLWQVDASLPEPEMVEVLSEAASIVRMGGVIVYPTETFYGLGGNPFNVSAIQRIYAIKGREFQKPLPLIADRMESVRKVAAEWSSEALEMAERFWPGPLTLILSLTGLLPTFVHGGSGKIAIRISPHPVARVLAALCGGVIISTSANISGTPPFSDLSRTPVEMKEKVDGLVDAGVLSGKLPSTIVDVTVRPPKLIREGAVPWEYVTAR